MSRLEGRRLGGVDDEECEHAEQDQHDKPARGTREHE